MSDPVSNPTASSEITGRAEFSELLMLLNYARDATFVFALYNTAGAREEVAEAVKRIISPTPVFTWRYKTESPFPISYLDRLTEEQRRQRAVVFFVDLERGDEKAWKSLDHNRDYLGARPHTLVFWVTGKGRVDAANKAPHFWAQRSLVFDFTVEQPEQQMELRTEWAGRGLWIENFDDAERQLSLFRGLLDEFDEMPSAPPQTLADLNGKVAWLLHYLDRREEALPFLREQLDLARKIGDRNLEAEALVNLAQVERVRTGRFAAIKLLEQAEGLATTPEKRAEVLRNLASNYTYEGKSAEGLSLLDQALTLFKQVGDNLGQANVLKAIGDVQSFRKEMDAALQSYDQALTLFKQVGSNLGQANIQLAVGIIKKDETHFLEALRYYEAIKLDHNVAVCKVRYGLMLCDRSETDRGIALMNEAREIWVAMDHPSGVRWIDGLLDQEQEAEDAE